MAFIVTRRPATPPRIPGVTFPWLELSGIQIKPIILYRGCLEQEHRARVTPGYHAWWYLEEGHITVEIGSQIHHVHPGEWIFLPPGGKRFQKIECGSAYTSFNFMATWENGIPLLHLHSPIIRKREATHPDLPALAETLCRIVESGSGPGFLALRDRELTIPDYIHSQAALHTFVDALFRQALACGATMPPRDKGDKRLEQVLSNLRRTPQAGPLPFEEWKTMTGLGRSQLDRLARRILGMSLHQFRDAQLLVEVRKRLTTQAIVKQIAKELGFVDTAHFCRWVRLHTGHTPQKLKTLQI